MSEVTEQTGLREFAAALRAAPRTLWRSALRHGTRDSRRTRAQTVFSNVFLHVHSIRTHRFSLKWSYTLGLGVMATAALLTLTVTGLLLMVYYKPSTELAYDSVKDIVYVVPAGRLCRNVHRWAAHVMVVVVFLHMARVFMTASYKDGRAFNWLVGMALLVLTLALSFTGYLLPWDQLSYWAVTIGANIAASPTELTDATGVTPYFDPGSLMRRLLLGADTIGNDALIRFYFLHCLLLPGLMFMLLAVHFWRIRKDGGLSRPDDIAEAELHGIATDERAESSFSGEKDSDRRPVLLGTVGGSAKLADRGPENTVPSLPHAFRAELAAALLITAITLVLALFFDAPLKEAANPAVPENPAKAPWYFLGLQELVGYSAFMGGVGLPSLALFGLALVPLLDRQPSRIGRWAENRAGRIEALWAAVFALVVCVAMLTITVQLGWLRNWFSGTPQLVIIFVNPGTVIASCFIAYSLLSIRRTGSVRVGAITLFTMFMVGFMVLTYFATVHRGPNWDFYWWPSQWPGH